MARLLPFLLLFLNPPAAVTTETPAAFDWSDSNAFETLQVVPHVSGLRLENKASADGAFLGYTSAGETVVEPDTPVNVIIFGFWLDKVEYVTFTDSNCITSEFNISNKDFEMQTERRIELTMQFPDIEPSWRMCVKQKGKGGELLMVEGIHTWISTSATVQEHYMPLYVQWTVLAVLLCMSALFSGLNLGLMSLSTNELQLIIKCGSKTEKRYAQAILPVRRRGNQLLCTILLMNVVVNASISLLFEDLTTGTVAFLTSSAGIVVFGEICPQSICVKKGLAVGARTLFLTKFFMIVTYPLAYPISKILDCLLGEEVDKVDRKRLLELMKMTSAESNDFSADLKIAVGAMEIATKKVKDVMTKIGDVYMLSSNTMLNSTTMAEIAGKGYTRIPIYEENNRNKVISLLFVKDLALVNKSSSITLQTVSGYHRHRVRVVGENTPLTQMLEEFKAGEYHLAMVQKEVREHSDSYLQETIATVDYNGVAVSLVEPPEEGEIVGLITLEDIVEEILQAEIIDESDHITDNVQRQKRHIQIGKTSLDISRLLGQEKTGEISVHTKIVLCKFLRDHHPLFSEQCMEQRALEMLIEKNVRQVHVHGERPIQLFEFGVLSKRAMVILEGTAKANFQKSGMSLTAGAWIAMGDVLFTKLEHHLVSSPNEVNMNLSFVPDFSFSVEKYCKFVQFPIPALYHALKVSKFLRSIRTPPRSPSPSEISRGSKGSRVVRFKDQAEEPVRRERNGSAIHAPSDAELTVPVERARSVSSVSATRRP